MQTPQLRAGQHIPLPGTNATVSRVSRSQAVVAFSDGTVLHLSHCDLPLLPNGECPFPHCNLASHVRYVDWPLPPGLEIQ